MTSGEVESCCRTASAKRAWVRIPGGGMPLVGVGVTGWSSHRRGWPTQGGMGMGEVGGRSGTRGVVDLFKMTNPNARVCLETMVNL